MLSRRLLGLVLVGGVSLLVGTGIAAAQAGGPTPPPPDAAAGVARQVTLSPQEQVAQAEGIVSRMESTRNTVRRQLETARTQRDVVKVLCLNDKLNQIDVAIRSAKERKQALEAAAQRNDADLASHEFTILGVLRQRADQLTAEANQCIGEEGVSIDEAAVNVTVEDIPKEDPSEYPSSDVVIDLPSCASCFK
jgi:hypothetical protein